ALQASEALLQQQQEELRVSNEELEAHANMLQEKNLIDQRKNADLQAIRQELEQKASALEQASRYKSEFLSNMSHELRTPLNSLLILADSFVQNEDGNLTPQQVEDARIIHNSGKDLLGLINEILDLAKIEAGRMDVHLDTLSIQEFAQDLERNFRHVANKKGVEWVIDIPEPLLNETLNTDREKVSRILKNLLSNAFKFTSQGSVTLGFSLSRENTIAMSVTDTGIGIPKEKQSTIFEAFQQADGSTSRQYGGTGLGLTISSQLAKLLGGEIQVESQENLGSRFTLLLPVNEAPTLPAKAIPAALKDDRDQVQPGDRVMLVIEDDPNFTRIIVQFAHDHGFKCLTAADGQTGLELARRHLPTGIILDIGLPILDGWSVLEKLKESPTTQHIPVHIMSATDLEIDGLPKGAAGQYTKPVSRKNIEEAFSRTNQLAGQTPQIDEVALFLHKVERGLPPEQRQTIQKLQDPAEVFKNKTILVTDDDVRNTYALARQLERKLLRVHLAANGEKALAALEQHPNIDCVLMDVMMPVMDGYEAIRRIRQQPRFQNLPIIALTAKAMEEDRRQCMEAGANDYLAKPVDMNKLFSMLSIWLYR
ncbi:MAG: response regulator, partial [Magnetococcales bacterium]|nr:response regulator [Magnetococcales bacterium]